MSLQVGQKVNYVPGEAHATQKRNGEYAWKFGWLASPEIVDPSGRVMTKAKVVPLDTNDEIQQKLSFIRNHPQGDEVRKQLILLHPIACWPATVRNVRDDGKVDLDIDCGGGGTLHCDGVETNDDKFAHSCHAAGEV